MYKQYLLGFTKPPVVLVALFTALILPLVSLPELSHASMTNTRADAWNTDYNNAANWMTSNGGGVDVYSNGNTADLRDCSGNIVSTYAAACKRSVNDVVSGAENQCVELFNRLYLTKGWINSSWTYVGGTHPDTDVDTCGLTPAMLSTSTRMAMPPSTKPLAARHCRYLPGRMSAGRTQLPSYQATACRSSCPTRRTVRTSKATRAVKNSKR